MNHASPLTALITAQLRYCRLVYPHTPTRIETYITGLGFSGFRLMVAGVVQVEVYEDGVVFLSTALEDRLLDRGRGLR
jgi:hypothetical protein